MLHTLDSNPLRGSNAGFTITFHRSEIDDTNHTSLQKDSLCNTPTPGGSKFLEKSCAILILEILRTVIARDTAGVFQLQNFVIIGIIAAVRHILAVGAYITLPKKTQQD